MKDTMFSADDLLAPISAAQPCGADLAFSPDLDAIARARQFDDPSLEQGEWVTELKEADWGFVVDRCARLLAEQTKDLRQISRGQLKIDGSNVSLRGEVGNEALRQRIASNVATNLNPTYTVNNGLRVAAAEQALLDNTLANRTVEFESGKATLTPTGRAILDEMVAAMLKLKGRRIEIIGHTDSAGLRASNVSLSQARAATVKSYLAAHGIAEDNLSASGQGPDRPIASNDSAEGRARNRRIEFRLAQ